MSQRSTHEGSTQRKQRVREKRNRKLSSELLAFNNGVSFLIRNTIKVGKPSSSVKNTCTTAENSVT